MADTISLPFQQDASIYKNADFSQISMQFFTDTAGDDVKDFTLSTFTGEVLDKIGGTKKFDFTFNTPDDSGQILPTLTEAQLVTLTGRKLHYWVKVDTGPYYFGTLFVSSDFVAGGA